MSNVDQAVTKKDTFWFMAKLLSFCLLLVLAFFGLILVFGYNGIKPAGATTENCGHIKTSPINDVSTIFLKQGQSLLLEDRKGKKLLIKSIAE